MNNKNLVEKIKFEINDLISHKRENLLDIIEKTNLDKSNIKFILIGANDGIVNDPVAPFIKKYNWEGLFIEPVKKYFKDLEKNYGNNGNIILENVAIGNEEEQKEIYFISEEAPFLTKKLGKRLASFHEDVIKSHSWYIPKIQNNLDSEKVKVKRLEQLLNKHNYWDANTLVLDVEGHELKIIEKINFNKFKPQIIYFETKHLNKISNLKIKNILENHKYKIFDLGRDSYGIKQNNN